MEGPVLYILPKGIQVLWKAENSINLFQYPLCYNTTNDKNQLSGSVVMKASDSFSLVTDEMPSQPGMWDSPTLWTNLPLTLYSPLLPLLPTNHSLLLAHSLAPFFFSLSLQLESPGQRQQAQVQCLQACQSLPPPPRLTLISSLEPPHGTPPSGIIVASSKFLHYMNSAPLYLCSSYCPAQYFVHDISQVKNQTQKATRCLTPLIWNIQSR